MKYFALIFLSFTIFLPGVVDAQLVPCGTDGVACTECHLVEMGNTAIVWLIGIMFIIFGFVAVSAGWGLVTAGGNPGALSEAKGKLTNALIGLIIVLAAWLIIDTLMRQLLNNGDLTQYDGFGLWSEIECGSMADTFSNPTEFAAEDSTFGGPVLPTAGGACPGGYTMDAFGSCAYQASTVSPDAGGNCPTGYTFGEFGDCEFAGTVSTGVTSNPAMNPIYDPADGGSSMVQPGAAQRMQETLNGPFERLKQSFGRTIVINDAIAKSGTSRESQTANSRHFHGDALDLSTAGMSDADKVRLFREAKNAGFTGFGFGNTILHVDMGSKRAWDYGNSTYGGVSVETLKAEARR